MTELRRYEVTVDGFDGRYYYALSPAKARYDCFLDYRCAYTETTFKEFLKRSSIRRCDLVHPEDDGYANLRRNYPNACIPKPGTRIKAEGHTGIVLAAHSSVNYVQFFSDQHRQKVNVHPSSVELAS
jgi:hypothetical protein